MSKSPAKIIQNTANSPFMQKVGRENAMTQNQITEIVFDFVYGGTQLSLVDYVGSRING